MLGPQVLHDPLLGHQDGLAHVAHKQFIKPLRVLSVHSEYGSDQLTLLQIKLFHLENAENER